MMVVPEDFYNSLFKQPNALNDPLDVHIVDKTSKMSSILHDDKLDDYKKFQMYTNELKKLLKNRQDRAEKPMQVALKDVSPDLLNKTESKISSSL